MVDITSIESYRFRQKGKKINQTDYSITKTSENSLTLLLNADHLTANSLYTNICFKIPSLRIVQIKVVTNTSIYNNQILAQKLGLIPIVGDAEKIPIIMEGSVVNDTNSYVLELKMECPDDLEVSLPITTKNLISKQDNVYPLYDDTKIGSLTKGQAIHIFCYVVRGDGDSHVGWKVVSNVGFRQLPRISIRKQPPNPEKLKSICPKNVFDIEDSLLIVKRPDDCIMCKACISDEFSSGSNPSDPPYVNLARNSKQYELTINSLGTIDCETILNKAIELHNNSL